MHSSNHKAQYINILTRTKHYWTSAQRIFNWDTSDYLGHKYGKVDFPTEQNKPQGQLRTPQSVSALITARLSTVTSSSINKYKTHWAYNVNSKCLLEIFFALINIKQAPRMFRLSGTRNACCLSSKCSVHGCWSIEESAELADGPCRLCCAVEGGETDKTKRKWTAPSLAFEKSTDQNHSLHCIMYMHRYAYATTWWLKSK